MIGTIEGDFNDIGKNNEPHILGISGLLTSYAEPMRQAINLIKKVCKKIPIIIVGGNKVNEDWIKYIGADYGTSNAVTGLKVISEIINSLKE